MTIQEVRLERINIVIVLRKQMFTRIGRPNQ